MADKVNDVEAIIGESEKTKTTEEAPVVAVDDESSKSENGDSTENGDVAEKENGKEEDDGASSEEKNGDSTADDVDSEKVSSIKRKSTGGDAVDGTPAEGVTPEKKAKLDEAVEPESNGESQVA